MADISPAAPTLVVVGYGPGISHAVAAHFGHEGYRVALVGRTESRLAEGVEALAGQGVDAAAFAGDASDVDSLRDVLRRIRADRGPVSALVWTAFRGGNVQDVLAVDPAGTAAVFDVGVRGLLAAVQELRPDLVATGGAVLVANGALGEPVDQLDRLSVMLGGDGTSLENAAKSKLVGLLAARLGPEGVYVGQVTVAGSVAGTATASPTAIDPAIIAELFWSMAEGRQQVRERVVE